MPIATACDCGKSGKVKEELAGKKVRCPGCGHSINVPLLAESLDDDEGGSERFVKGLLGSD